MNLSFVKNVTEAELHTWVCRSNIPSTYIHLALCILGVFSTGINSLVLTRKQMRIHGFNVLLSGLQVSNLILLSFYLPSLIYKIVCPVYLFQTWVTILFGVLSDMPRALVVFTNWMTFFIGFWRFAAVTWPLQSRTHLTTKLSVIVIPVTAAFSTIVSFYLFFGLQTNIITLNIVDRNMNTSYVISMYDRTTETLGSLHMHDFNIPVFIAIHIVGYVIPCVLSVSVNVGLIVSVFLRSCRRRNLVEGQTSGSSHNNERRMTIVLVVMLMANVFCYVSPGIFILVNAICPGDCGPSMPGGWHDIFDDYQAVLVLNCLEFFGYYLMSENFRKTFWELVKTLRLKTELYYNRVDCHCRKANIPQDVS